jgi:hypothetical protein
MFVFAFMEMLIMYRPVGDLRAYGTVSFKRKNEFEIPCHIMTVSAFMGRVCACIDLALFMHQTDRWQHM